MKCSIIIATYNWSVALDVILSYLIPQIGNNSDKFELLVADDGSTQDTYDVIAKYKKQFSNIQHIWHPDIGFRKAKILNQAVLASTGEYLIFLDGDCVTFPDFLHQHLKLAEPGYFVAGNRVLLSNNFTQQILSKPIIIDRIFNEWSVFDWVVARFANKQVNKIFPWLRLHAYSRFRYLKVRDWRRPKGCNFAVWRTDFLAVNGFDELFSGWGHEDADLFVRLLHYGVLIKDGRLAIPVLHLWHKYVSRDNEQSNYEELMKRVSDKTFIKAVRGIH